MSCTFCRASLIILFVSLCLNSPNALHGDTFLNFTTSSTELADGLSNGDSVTADGITITFSNVVVSDGSSTGDVEADGILMSSTTEVGLSDVISFDFTFSESVLIDLYNIGLHEDVPASRSFTVSGFNGTSGANSIPSGTSFSESIFAFDAGTIPFFAAGQTYSFTHNLPSSNGSPDPLFDLKGFTVSAIPEPGSAGLLMIASLAALWRRRKK